MTRGNARIHTRILQVAATSDPGHWRRSAPRHTRRLPVLGRLRPLERSRVPGDVLAGVTLAALGIPEVLGYATIARMPVVTGLYTILAPMAVFAVLGSSRHLVVGADSATAAILAAGVTGLAAPGSHRYVQLAGLAALLTGVLLVLARLLRLGFLANFLSRTVLIGFLTGVGISVAVGQLPGLLGIDVSGRSSIPKLVGAVEALPSTSLTTLAVSVTALIMVVGVRRLTRRVPGALVVVVGSIVASVLLNLPAHGVRTLGPVPSGIPSLTVPALSVADSRAVLATAVSMFVVILAQSSATSRAYAARYDEQLDEDTDLVGLGAANAAAAFTSTFVVNGSPTKTQMVDSAGGRSQLSQLTCCTVVLLVLLFLTGPLAHLPIAVLAAVVFLIGVELIDVAGMRRILRLRRAEFMVALLTVAAVVVLGVEQGIALAVVASLVDHLRHSYDPTTLVLVRGADGHWRTEPARPDARTTGGLVVYRFMSSLYYANAHRFAGDITAFLASTDISIGPSIDSSAIPPAPPLHVLCLDASAIADIDFTAAQTLRHVAAQLADHSVRLEFSSVTDVVRAELQRYGVLGGKESPVVHPTSGAALDAYRAAHGDIDH